MGKCWKNVIIIGFLDIFLDILQKKMKENLGQDRAKGDFFPSRAKWEQLPLISIDSLSSTDPTFFKEYQQNLSRQRHLKRMSPVVYKALFCQLLVGQIGEKNHHSTAFCEEELKI